MTIEEKGIMARTQSRIIIKVLQNKGDTTFTKPHCNSMGRRVSWDC